jgi:hypothetical protein
LKGPPLPPSGRNPTPVNPNGVSRVPGAESHAELF